ncbi:MAG: hypothetical protein MZV70_05845 [Desulfobacterales bacterium]|nr:hypothetical protein [Desulfobacterales bacterium]
MKLQGDVYEALFPRTGRVVFGMFLRRRPAGGLRTRVDPPSRRRFRRPGREAVPAALERYDTGAPAAPSEPASSPPPHPDRRHLPGIYPGRAGEHQRLRAAQLRGRQHHHRGGRHQLVPASPCPSEGGSGSGSIIDPRAATS